MAKTNFENLKVYQMSENLADQIWDVVLGMGSVCAGYLRRSDSARSG